MKDTAKSLNDSYTYGSSILTHISILKNVSNLLKHTVEGSLVERELIIVGCLCFLILTWYACWVTHPTADRNKILNKVCDWNERCRKLQSILGFRCSSDIEPFL